MRRIREVLRLHLQAGLSYTEVSRALKVSKSVVGKYVSLARAAGVDWDAAQTLSDEDLDARLYRPALPRSSHQLAPDFALVHQELKRAGVTLMLLWEEYARRKPLAYKYTSFCINDPLTGRQPHSSGCKNSIGHVPEITGHVPEFGGHATETVGHDDPKCAPRFHIHFTPTSSSWLNMVERFFRDITEKRIRRGVFTSVPDLEAAINEYIKRHNDQPKAFIWTAKAKDILAKVTRARAALNKNTSN